MKPAIGFVPSLLGDTPSPFRSLANNSGKFKVEDILDSCFVRHNHWLIEEFLVKWLGNDLFEAIWELLVNFTKCPDMLSLFC